jgi:hypothetical protein
MGKQFRLFEAEQLTHWQERAGDYNNNVIKQIAGGDIDKAKNFPTSIPSPFARMDLFRSAFAAFENPSLSIDGDSNNHRIIGECLDMVELLYNYESIKDRMKISVWDRNAALPLLESSGSDGHKLLQKTLNLFLNQDKASFNFESFHRMYIFSLDGYILGGTSPKTLVFTSANPKEFSKISFGDVELFSGQPKPLYSRNRDFIKYVFSLFQSSELKNKMSEFYNYMLKNLDKIQREDLSFFTEISNLDVNSINDYTEIYSDTLRVDIFSIPLRKLKGTDLFDKIESESQFLIHTSRPVEGPLPMVLAENGYLGHLNYTDSATKWDVNQKIESTNLALKDRTLPGKSIKYPNYRIDDFLTSSIYELPYTINKAHYFDGNFQNETSNYDDVGYLLPLTSVFFKYFSLDDLKTRKFKGNPMIEIIRRNSFVQVNLRIPINRGENVIELTKKYLVEDQNKAQGKIVSCNKYFSIYPFVKTESNPHYYVQIIDSDGNDSPSALQLKMRYDQYEPSHTALKSKYGRNSSFYNTIYQQVERHFETVQIKQTDTDCSNYLIPLWKEVPQAGNSLTFSIDFGTSNTHIEYAASNERPRELAFTSEGNGYGYSFDFNTVKSGEVGQLINSEFFPNEINAEYNVKFPLRTAIFDVGNYNATSYKPILDYNVGFYYEKTPILKSNDSKVKTNLKWLNEGVSNQEQKAWVHSYLDQLISMCKTKALIEGASLSGTKFIWTYPLSYGSYQINQISNLIEDIVIKYFGDNIEINPICESIAPFYSVSAEGKLLGSSNNILALDIGGGTIDSVIYQNNEVKNVSSMIFGANYLYGNGYEKSIRTNVFYRLGEEFISSIPDVEKKYAEVREEILKRENIEDLISLYYSFEDKVELRGQQNISFSKFLSDKPEVRLGLLFYYGSVIYFNIRNLKALGMNPPTKILFSGNGCKFLDQLDIAKRKTSLLDYTEKIINYVYEEDLKFTRNLEIIQTDNPKVLTAKGAISVSADDSLLDKVAMKNINNLFTTYLGDSCDTVISGENNISYTFLNEENYKSVIKEYKLFLSFFFNQRDVNIKDLFNLNFDIKNLLSAVLLNENRAKDFLETGVTFRRKQMSENEKITDPLFFYIIRGMLGDLFQKLFENK